jgi:hypothetical protein
MAVVDDKDETVEWRLWRERTKNPSCMNFLLYIMDRRKSGICLPLCSQSMVLLFGETASLSEQHSLREEGPADLNSNPVDRRGSVLRVKRKTIVFFVFVPRS